MIYYSHFYIIWHSVKEGSPKLNLEITKISAEDKDILKNLMSLYLHDMSEFADFLKLDPDGTYKYQNLDYYWQKKELSAFFIEVNNEIAGFILSNRKPYVPKDCDISIQEFFILKKYRGEGVGKKAALEFFRRSPGRYCIAQLVGNKPAISFWHSVYAGLDIKYDEKEESEYGARVLTQRFTI